MAAALAAPQHIVASAGNGSVTVNWNSVSNASSYHIYYATEPNIVPQNINSLENGTRIQNVASPYVINNLQNDKTYYVVVTAANGALESPGSAEANATPALDVAMQPTAQEVLVLELVNRARFDPSAEAARFSIGLNDGITGTPISASRKQPLAHNLLLIDSARKHSQWMLDNDIFAHEGENNNTPTNRMEAAGYLFAGSWNSGENIAWSGTTSSTINLTNYAVSQHEGLFKSSGHRVNILNGNFRELGVGQKQGYFLSNNINFLSAMLTQNFAKSGNNYFITGVVYNDLNGDDFYTVGEGLGGITITLNGESHKVFSTGAYSIPVSNGTYNLSITGPTIGTPLLYTVQVNGSNVKVDVIKSGAAIDVVSWQP